VASYGGTELMVASAKRNSRAIFVLIFSFIDGTALACYYIFCFVLRTLAATKLCVTNNTKVKFC
jgi:hypothetical protein